MPPIPLNNGEEYIPTLKDFEEWKQLYPNVDVKTEFGRMRQWSLSNPKKKKTPSGVRRFVTTWLDREQNKGGKSEPKDKLSQQLEDMKNW